MSRYIKLPKFGNAPSHPIMYNPSKLSADKVADVRAALLSLNEDAEGQDILENILNTPGLVETDAESHLSSYGNLVQNVPGISTYFSDKFDIQT